MNIVFRSVRLIGIACVSKSFKTCPLLVKLFLISQYNTGIIFLSIQNFSNLKGRLSKISHVLSNLNHFSY